MKSEGTLSRIAGFIVQRADDDTMLTDDDTKLDDDTKPMVIQSLLMIQSQMMMMPMHDLRDDRGDDSNGEKDCYVDKYDFNNEKK